MALINAEVDAAIPVDGIPDRSLANAALKQVITDIAAKANSSHDHIASDVTDFNTAVDARIDLAGPAGVWGEITGTLSAQTDLQTALNNKLDDSQVSAYALTLLDDADAAAARATLVAAQLLVPVNETGTTFNITSTNGNNTEIRATNGSGQTGTFNFTGMVAGDAGRVTQLGAGTVTLAAGPTYSYAPGVTNSPTTSGQRGHIDWQYLGGTSVLIQDRSQTSSGSGNSTRYVNLTDYTAVDDTNINEITTVSLPLGMVAGTSVKIRVIFEHASGSTNAASVFAYLNGTQLAYHNGGSGNSNPLSARVPLDFDVRSDTAVFFVAQQKDGDYQGLLGDSTTVSSLTSTATLSIRIQKAATGRVVKVRGIYVDVIAPT